MGAIFELGDVVVTKANNLAIITSFLGGENCRLELVKVEKPKHFADYLFAGVPLEGLTKTGLNQKMSIQRTGEFSDKIERYITTFRPTECTAGGELFFAMFEEWESADEETKRSQRCRAILSASRAMDELATKWQLVRV